MTEKELKDLGRFLMAMVLAWGCLYIAYNDFAYNNNLAPLTIGRSLLWLGGFGNAIKAIKMLWKA